ncbi:MAG: LCP family protein [Marmoricola sp.]
MSSPRAGSPPRGALRDTRQKTFGHTVRWTVGVVVVPGVVLAVAGYLYVRTEGWSLATGVAVVPRELEIVAAAGAVGAVVWLSLVLVTYLRSRPSRPTNAQRFIGALMTMVLGLAVVAPLATVSYYALVQRDAINTVVTNERSATAPVLKHVTRANLWGDKRRVNLLLLGGDGGVGRTGIRTDSVILVSIDTHTGKTVMFSLPRNLRNVPFPAGSPLAALYPNGFEECCSPGESMLNAIYRNVPAVHPGVLGTSDNEGADAVKLGVSGALGVPVDYYLLVNLNGFQQIVDAIGGITVNINEPVPINGNTDQHILPTGYLQPGPNQHLNGFKALWFTRGRFGSTDYKRMERQRCAMNAIVHEARPVKLFTRYTQLASASKKIVRTDIPQQMLPAFVDTALRMKGQPLRSVVFQLSASFNPNAPDFDYLHAAVQRALHPVQVKMRPAGLRGGLGAVNTGTGKIDVPTTDETTTEATNADSDCTYQPVSAVVAQTTTP